MDVQKPFRDAMSKTSETKSKILEMLKGGSKRLTDIYPQLGLSASTVSQHLKELEDMNLVRGVTDPHFRNMRNYSLINAAESQAIARNRVPMRMVRVALGALAIIAAFSVFVLFGGNAVHSQNAGMLDILLTDPPHVPVGTQSLNITYSSLQIRLSNSAASEWLSINMSGADDLMSLINISKVIATVNVPSNTIIDKAAFNITGATIRIGNVSYPVLLQQSRLVANVSSNPANATSSLLLDLSPTVLAIYTDNSTLFVMSPSVKAVMVPKSSLGMQIINGSEKRFEMGAAMRNRLSDELSSISMLSGSISSAGNYTRITVTVKDNSNSTVVLKHLMIFGNESLYVNSNSTIRPEAGSVSIPERRSPSMSGMDLHDESQHGRNVTGGDSHSGSVKNQESHDAPFNAIEAYNLTTGEINASRYHSETADEGMGIGGRWASVGNFISAPMNIGHDSTSSMHGAAAVGRGYALAQEKVRFGVLNFAIGSGGALSLPSLAAHKIDNASESHSAVANGSGGYALLPGQTATLTFYSPLYLGGNSVLVHFINGTSYRVEVIGEQDEFALVNITAG